MFYQDCAHDIDTPVHPVSAPDYMPIGQLRALQLHRLQGVVRRIYDNVPLTRKRMDERGVKPEHIQTLADIALLPFSVKSDLRDEYPHGLFASPMNEIVRFHCSSGTTGKPIVIGNTRNDIILWQQTCMRALAMCGVRSSDVMQVTYGYGLFTGGLGLHYGGEGIGCAVLPISGGNTERQLMMMRDMGVTVIACTPSYFLHLVDEGHKRGINFRTDTKLKHGIFGAEPWSEEMRTKIQDATGITAHDIYGLTEICGPGVANDCQYHNGLHIFEDHFYPEIIDPETLEPQPDGIAGELVFTTLTRTGTPMLRYRTRDISRLNTKACECGRTIRTFERVSARSDDMLIIRGVNVFPSQIESGLLQVDKVLPHYMINITREGDLDKLEIQVEVTRETFGDDIRSLEILRSEIAHSVQRIINISASIRLVEPNTLPRSEGKIQRVRDMR
ncbi:MAG: phenylacetate--CoA ligase [Kiritimatiellae bacterium]|nr:phenylacetate--CoA ligase [Kiritimatiellia bacterium]